MEESGLTPRPYSWPQLILLYGMWLAFFLYVVRIAWVAEDAYITFRVIENFMAGYGLTWNIHERVQAYTHPLWMLLHIPLQALIHNVFFTSITLSVLCVAYATAVILYTAQKPVWHAAIFFFMPLVISKSFMDYTSSGLENPLSYLLYACFIYVVLRKQQHRFFWFFCSLVVALSLFNRMDTIWLFAPALTYLGLNTTVRWRQVIAGVLPFAGWLLFSLFYYGFIFANTKYAKLQTGMDYDLYLSQGLEYFRHLIVIDASSAVILLSITVFFLPERFRPVLSSSLPIMLAAGIIIQVVYTILVGGDYMMGRFWALPIFAAVSLWFINMPTRWRPDILFAIVCLFITAHFSSQMLIDMRQDCKDCVPLNGRVINAHFVFGMNALVMKLDPLQLRSEGHYPFSRDGEKLRKENTDIKRLFFVGMPAYYAGPAVNVIDELGLADALLARLPASKRQHFYISHFRRDIPNGYEDALRTGKLTMMEPNLARYYRALRLIISGNLLDTTRLKTILLFNLGYYDYWKEQHLSGMKKAEAKKDGRKK